MEYDTNPFVDGSFQAAPKSLEELRWEAILESAERGGYVELLGSTASRESQLARLRKEGPSIGSPVVTQVVEFPQQRTEMPQVSNF